jgi:hypothetical protein
VAAFIERHRSKRLIVSIDDIALCIDRLRGIIHTDQDPDRVIKATRQLARFLLSQQKDGISPSTAPPVPTIPATIQAIKML